MRNRKDEMNISVEGGGGVVFGNSILSEAAGDEKKILQFHPLEVTPIPTAFGRGVSNGVSANHQYLG